MHNTSNLLSSFYKRMGPRISRLVRFSICIEKLLTTLIICLIMLHPGIFYHSARVQTKCRGKIQISTSVRRLGPFHVTCMMYIDGYMYDMQVDRLQESLIQSLHIFNDLTSDGVWKSGLVM